uniref:HTH-type transcriptional regulator hpr n=1 Tax=Anthurium amnicola TaxID=1678845 RepID=A0A1D1XUE7_9ARAE
MFSSSPHMCFYHNGDAYLFCSDTFRSELQALISACRLTRTYTEQICCSLIQQCVTVVDHGYSIIDLNKLNPSNVEDVCLSKLLAVLLQFVSQRHRPVRGGVSNLLLDYIRNIPCKTSLTAAGCYLCAVPKSKGTKIMISVSLESPQPSGTEISHKHSREGSCSLNEINEIMMVAKLYSGKSLDASDVPFLKATSSETVLKEAKELNIISESTYNSILLLKMEECKNFNAKTELKSDPEMRQKMESTSISRIQLHPGQSCHFMNRFLVTWECCEKTMQDIITPTDLDCNSKDAIMHCICGPCMIGHETASIRHMVDTDWTYLANMSKNHTPDFQGTLFSSAEEKEKNAVKTTCSNYVQLSAQGALQVLKSIPVPARRSLPVLVDSQDALLCIPSMQFQRWPDLLVTARFVPRVPLGGGFSSFL